MGILNGANKYFIGVISIPRISLIHSGSQKPVDSSRRTSVMKAAFFFAFVLL